MQHKAFKVLRMLLKEFAMMRFLYRLSFLVVLFALVFVADTDAQTPIGFRSEKPGAFLHWPLPANITVNRISRLPNTPWTWEFLGIHNCPQYPARIDPGKWWDGKSYGGNRSQIRPGTPDSRVKWMNIYATNELQDAFACYYDHAGTDISATNGTPIYAAADGVLRMGTSSTGSRYLYMQHDNVNGSGQTWLTIYLHAINIQNNLIGTSVRQGTKIAEVGAGHLHFEVARNARSYANSRNPWGIDSAPWDGCLWVNQSLCQAMPNTFRTGQDAQNWKNLNDWAWRFGHSYERAGLRPNEDYATTNAAGGTQVFRRPSENNALLLLVANISSDRVNFVRRGFASFMMNNGFPMNRPALLTDTWGPGIQGPPTSDEVYINGVAHQFFHNGYLIWNQSANRAEFNPYPTVNVAQTWWCRYFNGAFGSGRSASEACNYPDSGFTIDWGNGAYPGMRSDWWSFRTSRQLTFPGGPHAFKLEVDSDATATLYIRYNLQSEQTALISVNGKSETRTVDIPAGDHILIIDYHERQGNAWLKFSHAPVPPSSPACAADVNGDGAVDMLDIQIIAGNPTNPRHDLNGDGRVDLLDIQQAASLYRQVCR